ncbi:MAG TPA: PfkB family carbohydrate kinase [Acidobacteriota bacterium]|nr:PfkB family carbohydrate kinase [Acidobacteriota bacterium]
MLDLLEYLPKLRGKKIGVYGDLIADEYVFGTINRFSREAPVFVVNFEDSKIGLGGAANAVNNIQDLGGIPYPFGIVGEDPAGRTLLSLLREKGITTEGILSQESHPTFVKQRVIAGSPHSVKQQILRVDRCLHLPSDAVCHRELQQRTLAALHQLDAFLVSDYGLGVAQPTHLESVFQDLRRRQIPCFVDSRHNLGSYRGITAATPNEPEVESIIGKTLGADGLLQAGNMLLDQLDSKAILITRGKSGMTLFTRNADPVSIPIFGSSDIVDVTGAGDTVVGAFALAVCAGASFYDAARLANCAAGIVVMKRGAATVLPQELVDAIRTEVQRRRG